MLRFPFDVSGRRFLRPVLFFFLRRLLFITHARRFLLPRPSLLICALFAGVPSAASFFYWFLNVGYFHLFLKELNRLIWHWLRLFFFLFFPRLGRLAGATRVAVGLIPPNWALSPKLFFVFGCWWFFFFFFLFPFFFCRDSDRRDLFFCHVVQVQLFRVSTGAEFRRARHCSFLVLVFAQPAPVSFFLRLCVLPCLLPVVFL